VRGTLRERLLAKVIIDLDAPRTVDDAPCWLWTGMDNGHGYGLLKVNRRKLMAHRLVYQMLAGPIPEGLQIDHLCRVHRCVNPAHLEPVTCRENLLRGETFQAANAAKTHCIRDHEFTPENTRLVPGGRACRTCERDYGRDWQRNRRASRKASS